MSNSNKKAAIGIVAAVMIGAAATGVAYYANVAQAYVAKVNGQSVQMVDYQKAFDAQKKQYAKQYGIDFSSEQGKNIEKDMKKGLVNQLVERQIILNEATKRNITISDKQIDDKIAEIKKGFPNDDGFNKALQDNGMTLSDLKHRVRDGLTVEAVINDVTKDVKVTPEDAQAFYDKNQQMFKKPEEMDASHILVKDQKLAEKLLAQLKGGADFAALAKANSVDPGSKDKGGDLGFFSKGRMVPEFEKAAFALQPGQLSGIVKTQFGYHIIKGGAHHPARVQPFAEVQPQLMDQLKKQKQQQEFTKWLTEQKKAVKVEYKDGFDPNAQPSYPPAGSQPQNTGRLIPGQPAPGGAQAPAGKAPAGAPPAGAPPAAPTK